jgi:cytochrome P450
MNDLIGYAVAWTAPGEGVHVCPGEPRSLEQAEILLAAKRIESTLTYFLVEIYPDSRTVNSAQMLEEVMA